MTFSKKLLVLSLCAYSNVVIAQATPLLQHPFSGQAQGLSLQSGQNALDSRPLKYLAPQQLERSGLSSRYELRQKARSELSLRSDSTIETVGYGFALDKIPVCDLEVKIHRLQDGQTAILGDLPPSPQGSFDAAQWASLDRVHKIVSETLQMSALGSKFEVLSQDKCLFTEDGLKPVWRLVVSAEGLNYEVLADGNEVFRFDPRHFHGTGSAAVYPDNKKSAATVDIPLREMDDTGFLSNKYFQTCLPASGGRVFCKPSETESALYPFAKNSELVFNYDPDVDASKFTQASIFAHTNQALEWLEDHGYKNFGTKQLKLLPHSVFSNNEKNNALYQPGSSTTAPMILVGDGDGVGLQNLGTDADVVSHELGHHVVFASVTTISGESLVLHEALADFFTFARTGNACLGESICPTDGVFCAVRNQCLRSAENDYVFGGSNLPNQPHLKGQFISGMLWDMKTKDQIPIADLTTLVLKGIDLLVANSGYKHLIISMLLVDHADFKNKYCSDILARAKTRGLTSLLSDVTCESISSGTYTTLRPPEETASETAATVTKKSSKKSCGTLNGGSSGQSQGLLLILGLPIALSLIRRRKP